MTCGIYTIKNKVNGKIYVGSSNNIKRRWKQHRERIEKGEHSNEHLVSAWNKYGENSFEFSVIEECKKDILIEREQHWMDFYKAMDREFGYNKTKAQPFSHFSEETREKMSKAKKGRKLSERTKKLIGKAVTGHALSDEAKRKIGEKVTAAQTGRKHSEETRKKMKESRNKRVYTEEEKAELSRRMKENWAKNKNFAKKKEND